MGTDSPSPTFPAQMAAPALLAGGNMGTGVASLNLICEGIEAGVVKRRGGVGGAALTSGGAEGPTASMTTRTGSRSGAWMMRTKKWAPSMPPGPSCLSRYLQGGEGDFVRGWWAPACPKGGPFMALFSATHLPVVSPHPVQKGPKEPIPEEQELDFQGLEEEEEEPSEGLDEEGPEAGKPVGWTPAASSWVCGERPVWTGRVEEPGNSRPLS